MDIGSATVISLVGAESASIFFLSWSVQRVSLVVPVPDLRVRLGRPWIFGHVSRRQFLFLGISRHLVVVRACVLVAVSFSGRPHLSIFRA